MKRIFYPLCYLAVAIICGTSHSVFAQSTETLELSKSLTENNASKPITEPILEKIETSPDDPLFVIETDLWSRIRNGYAIPNLNNQLVTMQTNWYSARTNYLLRIIQRGSRYLYHVVDALDKRGMPTDLALLPFIESAFNPQAISTAKASGMWQFMPATGRDYNLRQTIFKDDRRGVLDSTDAALDYLERLYGMFGDWQLALAAYNWGEGSVQRAIKKQQALGLPIDFDSLSAFMPAETKNYVPKLQAVKNLIAHPEFYNISLPKLDNTPYFTTVKKVRDIDVNIAAKLAELPLSEFKALNPQFNRPVITASNNTKILLPIDNAALFENNLNTWKGPLSSWTTHSVARTERVELLANRLGFKPETVREVNFIPAKMYVKAGSTILIPKSTHAQDQNIPVQVAEQAQLTIEKRTQRTRKLVVHVGKKDNIASIAKRHQVTIADIKSWNKLHRDQLNTGQSLTLHVAVVEKSRHQRHAITKASSHKNKLNKNIKKSKARSTKKIATHAKSKRQNTHKDR